MSPFGSELANDSRLGRAERLYCRIFGVPILGLRIRWRRIQKLLPAIAEQVLDAGCGRGVISRALAVRYPNAQVDALDIESGNQRRNQEISQAVGINNCYFLVKDLTELRVENKYDLIVSVDNLEHIEDDQSVLDRFYTSLKPGGSLILHVPHYYRRWPLLRWVVNFDVPGHVRPGYHQAEIVERVAKAGFVVEKTGFSYGFLENITNNISYWITRAEERNRIVYAALFPFLNIFSWMGHWGRVPMGAGVWVMAHKIVLQGASVSGCLEDGL